MPDDFYNGFDGSGAAMNRVGENMQAERSGDPAASEPEQPKRPKTAKELEEEKNRKAAEIEEERRRKREEKKRQNELKNRRMKRKLITPGVVLVVGAIASITMFLKEFENSRMLIWLLVILLIAWIAGSLIQYMFEKFAYDNEHEMAEEGEVINKGLAPSDDVKAEENG
ncbi:MAG: hypothetical protein IJ058_04975 [Lachnospiraceae bacterium]|nr:hypothetical protein [Lachnospiraceae bacterium]